METNLLENQSSSALPKNNTKKPFIFALITFILTLFIAGVITGISVVAIQSSYEHVDPTPSKSIQVICSFAPYEHLCISALSSSISTNTSGDKFDPPFLPANIIFRSFQLTVYQLINLANIYNPDNIPELRECQALLSEDLSGLNNSVASSKNLYYFTKLEVDEYVEVFNRIKTSQQACLDRLEGSGSTVIDEIRLNVQNTRQYMSNSRAILLNIDNILDNIYGSSSDDDEFMIIYVPKYVLLLGCFIYLFSQQ